MPHFAPGGVDASALQPHFLSSKSQQRHRLRVAVEARQFLLNPFPTFGLADRPRGLIAVVLDPDQPEPGAPVAEEFGHFRPVQSALPPKFRVTLPNLVEALARFRPLSRDGA